MIFKDLKQGNTIYLFDRNTLDVTNGTVQSVSLPHYEAGNMTGMVVDVVIKTQNGSGQYELKDSSETAYANNGMLLITPNIDNLLNEIKLVKVQSETVLNSIDQHKETVKKCEKLLTELDPVFKNEKKNDERLSNLEDVVN